MNIIVNPRISGAFVHHVMDDDKVRDLMDELGLTKEKAHNLIKQVVITATRDLKLDMNRIINNIKDHQGD